MRRAGGHGGPRGREKPLAPPRAGSPGAAPQAEGGRSRRREPRLREGTAECRRSGDAWGEQPGPTDTERPALCFQSPERPHSALPYPLTQHTHTILAHRTHAASPLPWCPITLGTPPVGSAGLGDGALPSGPPRMGWSRTGPGRERISPAEGATASRSPASSRYRSVECAPGLSLVPCVTLN